MIEENRPQNGLVFKTVSVGDFRANLQDYVKGQLPLLLARHSDVVAVILSAKQYNDILVEMNALKAELKALKGEQKDAPTV